PVLSKLHSPAECWLRDDAASIPETLGAGSVAEPQSYNHDAHRIRRCSSRDKHFEIHLEISGSDSPSRRLHCPLPGKPESRHNRACLIDGGSKRIVRAGPAEIPSLDENVCS